MDGLTILLLLFLLQIKHLTADYICQPNSWHENKHRYTSPGGILHASLHAVLTLAALLIVQVQAPLAIAIAAFECVLHFHIDWFKAQISLKTGLDISQRNYWWLFGADQFVHQITYLLIVFMVIAKA